MLPVAEHYDQQQSDYLTAPFYAVVCPDQWRVTKSRGAVSRNAAERQARTHNLSSQCRHSTHAVVALWPPNKAVSDSLHNAICYGSSPWEGFGAKYNAILASAKVAYIPEGDYFASLDSVLPDLRANDIAALGALLREAQVICDRLGVQPFLPLSNHVR